MSIDEIEYFYKKFRKSVEDDGNISRDIILTTARHLSLAIDAYIVYKMARRPDYVELMLEFNK